VYDDNVKLEEEVRESKKELESQSDRFGLIKRKLDLRERHLLEREETFT